LQEPYPTEVFEAALELARQNVVDRAVFDALLRIHLPQKLQPGITTRYPEFNDKWTRQLSQLSRRTRKALLDLGRPLPRSDDANKRRTAAWLLAPFDVDACLPVLLASLKEDSDDELVRTEEVLARLGPKAKRAFAPLRAWLEKDLKTDKFYGPREGLILAALSRIDAEAAVPILMKSWREPPKLLQEPAGFWPGSSDLQASAFQLLLELGPRAKSIVPTLIGDLKRDRGVGEYPLLARIGPAAVPALQELAGHDHVDHQFKAAWVLGQIGAGAKPAVPALLKCLNAKDAKLRRAAVSALGLIDPGNDKVADALIALRMDADVEVRRQIVRIVGGIGVRAVPALTEALKDIDGEVRTGAASSLGHVGAKALSALREALKHKDVQVRRIAVLAFGKLGPDNRDAIAVLIEATRDRDRLTRRLAVSLLDRPGDQTATVVPVIAKALADEDAAVRWAAAFVLEELGTKAAAAVPALKEARKDDNQDVRRRVQFALRAILAKEHGGVE
jgi:HEAT repeat protein